MEKKNPTILQPFTRCQWNLRTVNGACYWEEGGCVRHKHGHGPSYVLIAPEDMPVTTIGLRSETCRKGFDHLYLRLGGLDACNLPIDAGQTTFIFVEKRDGATSHSLLSLWKRPFTYEGLLQMVRTMIQEANPASVGDIKSYLTTHRERDWQALVPLKPYQMHKFTYHGLKLGAFLSDHIDADPSLIGKLEEKTKSRLPEDYRSFILETNGGHLKNKVFFHGRGIRKPRLLKSFIRFDANREFALPKCHYRSDPPGFLCIARDANDLFIYLGIDKSIHGRVYWVAPKAYHDGFEKRSLPVSRRVGLPGVHLLAGSFSEFIGQLEATNELA